MKTLLISAGLAIAIVFIVGGCADRTRHTCETEPSGRRCDTSIGATTP
jgi:hypothetical protein